MSTAIYVHCIYRVKLRDRREREVFAAGVAASRKFRKHGRVFNYLNAQKTSQRARKRIKLLLTNYRDELMARWQ